MSDEEPKRRDVGDARLRTADVEEETRVVRVHRVTVNVSAVPHWVKGELWYPSERGRDANVENCAKVFERDEVARI